MRRRRSWRRSTFGQAIREVDDVLRELILLRDDERCGYCGTTSASEWHIEHIVPVHLGGGTNELNLTVACADCNLRKGAEFAPFWFRLLAANGTDVPATAARALLANVWNVTQ